MHPLLRVGTNPGHYVLLLMSLLALLLAGAVFSGQAHAVPVADVLLGMSMFATIYSVRDQRVFVLAGSTFATVTFAALVISQLSGSSVAQLVGLASGFIFFLHAALVILINILTRKRISTDELAGAVSAYLLVGISGAFIFALLDFADPGSILSTSDTLPAVFNELRFRPFGEYLYFSFTCLTTLGFGDLVPATPLTRVLAYLEAVIGQIYLTVLVARLVGLHLTHSRLDPG